jgi:hypothetical protein
MNLTEIDLHELLHERGDVDVAVAPGRLDGVHRRIRLMRIRRAVARAVAAAVAVTAILVGVHTAVGGGIPAPPDPSVAPATWTAVDGTVYRLVSTTTVESPNLSADVLVPTHGGGIAVRTRCDATSYRDQSAQLAAASQIVRIDGCGDGWSDPLDVPGAPDTLGWMDVPIAVAGPNPNIPQRARADWSFAFYEWTGSGRPAGPAPMSQRNFTSSGHVERVAGTASGTWPRQRTATFTVTPGSHAMTFVFLCEGAIGQASPGIVTVRYRINDEESDPTPFDCGHGSNLHTIIEPAAHRSTYTIAFVISSTVSQYDGRPSSWAIAVYTDSGDV